MRAATRTHDYGLPLASSVCLLLSRSTSSEKTTHHRKNDIIPVMSFFMRSSFFSVYMECTVEKMNIVVPITLLLIFLLLPEIPAPDRNADRDAVGHSGAVCAGQTMAAQEGTGKVNQRQAKGAPKRSTGAISESLPPGDFILRKMAVILRLLERCSLDCFRPGVSLQLKDRRLYIADGGCWTVSIAAAASTPSNTRLSTCRTARTCFKPCGEREAAGSPMTLL